MGAVSLFEDELERYLDSEPQRRRSGGVGYSGETVIYFAPSPRRAPPETIAVTRPKRNGPSLVAQKFAAERAEQEAQYLERWTREYVAGLGLWSEVTKGMAPLRRKR